jgi:hypothetical protein
VLIEHQSSPDRHGVSPDTLRGSRHAAPSGSGP